GILWGNPYAASFKIQTWPSANGATPYSATSNPWVDTSAGIQSGVTGSTQSVAFTTVNTRYVRVLMTASSAGAGGVYSIAEMNVTNGSGALITGLNTTSNGHVASSMDV